MALRNDPSPAAPPDRHPVHRGAVSRFLHEALLDPAAEAPATRAEQPGRRRLASVITLVVGAVVMWWSLRVPAGDPLFYPATLLLALVWFVGGRASGPVVPRRARPQHGEAPDRDVAHGLVLGLLLLATFLAGALVVTHIPPLSEPVQGLLDHARRGSLPIVALITAINGLAEEYFFRGALFQALPRRWQVVVSTVLYAVITAFSGVPLLVLAAVMLGVTVALQRRATGGFLAPTVTHLTWSLGMLFLLPGALELGTKLG